jgi:hypothetical protein
MHLNAFQKSICPHWSFCARVAGMERGVYFERCEANGRALYCFPNDSLSQAERFLIRFPILL